jgi:hydantoinase/carbamoylase family amidase
MRQRPNAAVRIDRERCAARIQDQIDRLSAPPFSSEVGSVTRYAFTGPYMRTVEHLSTELLELGFTVRFDPIGNLVARNRPPGTPVIGLGSHCDSVRGGGRYDGILGVIAAIEVARIAAEQGLELPLQVVSWVEEEASGFGQMLLGSRVAAGLLDARLLATDVRSIDDGRSFVDNAHDAGFAPEALGDAPDVLADLTAWIELHIEQGRVLEDGGERLGVVEAIAGYVHADIEIKGQADHAGATPMALRRDAGIVAAWCALESERLALEAGDGAVATVGELELDPGIINVVPGRARLSLDVRAPSDAAVTQIVGDLRRGTTAFAEARGLTASYRERQRVAATTLDGEVLEALVQAVDDTDVPWRRMISGAAHDTMCVAAHVPSAMLFVPCRGGISHSPAEHASADDAALGVEVLLNAALGLVA